MLLPFYTQNVREVGCDEAGRGCLAGPVFAAAVILPQNYEHSLLHDSKKLTDSQRKLLRPQIEQDALAWAVGIVSHTEIDSINILQASFLAMHRAIEQLQLVPEHILVDGNRFKQYKNIPHTCIVKGDGKYMSIAAASILAKTYRDDFMEAIHAEYPHFDWQSNKGYPTQKHRDAVREFGLSPHHRKTFNYATQLKLEL